jgi:acetyl esterase
LTLDPQLAPLLERVSAAPQLSSGTPEEGREAFRTMNALAARVAPRVEVGSVLDVSDGPVPMRIYRPEGSPAGTLMFIHGGGFVISTRTILSAACCARVRA